MPKTPDTDQRQLLRLPDNLFFRTSMLNFLMGRTLAPFYAEEKLLSHEWKLMGVLWSYAPLSASAIARYVTFDKAAISRALRSLEERELIARRAQSQDRRRTADVRLTRRGQQVYRRILTRVSLAQEQLLTNLTPDETSILFKAYGILEEHLRRQLDGGARKWPVETVHLKSLDVAEATAVNPPASEPYQRT
jgi:DNA-binding MarR family transcriptional regulator